MALPRLDKDALPRHVAIIMDGNGRWAAAHGVSRAEGHEAGAESVRRTVEACRELGGIDCLTLYAFSTENWRRSKVEVETLFRLLSKYIAQELDNLHEQGIRVTIMGRRERLSRRVRDDLDQAESVTAANRAMTLNVAINYGSRCEIVDAARGIARDVQLGKLRLEDVDEELFSEYLYIPDLPELDLLIRTSGEMRVSNFMLWQLFYAEIVVRPEFWPDFGKEHFHEAIAEYQARSRRFGGR